MENIDPVEYGKLIAQVEHLTYKVESMESDIKTLLALANQSKGGFWIGMTIAAVLGGVLTLVMNWFTK
jgi:hypothetical protein|tara:strand:- start:77 stop:280 length:204 start_codon:yes stop_codon:yes gene_type:complete